MCGISLRKFSSTIHVFEKSINYLKLLFFKISQKHNLIIFSNPYTLKDHVRDDMHFVNVYYIHMTLMRFVELNYG